MAQNEGTKTTKQNNRPVCFSNSTHSIKLHVIGPLHMVLQETAIMSSISIIFSVNPLGLLFLLDKFLLDIALFVYGLYGLYWELTINLIYFLFHRSIFLQVPIFKVASTTLIDVVVLIGLLLSCVVVVERSCSSNGNTRSINKLPRSINETL